MEQQGPKAHQHPKQLGQADSTQRSHDVAVELFDAHQKLHDDPPFAQLKWIHVVDDNLIQLMMRFASYLIGNKIRNRRTK
jgi:hypothetical protein